MKKFLRSPVVTGLMFLVAIALLVTGSFGTTQAALQYRSQDHESTYVLKHIGVALLENGSWAPQAVRVMKEMLAPCKNVEIVEPTITVRGALKAEQKAELEALVEALLA